MSQLLRTWKLYPRQWKLIPARGFYSVRVTGRGKTSAQPHTTLCIQFLDRENNDKNNTLPLGKQICFTEAVRKFYPGRLMSILAGWTCLKNFLMKPAAGFIIC